MVDMALLTYRYLADMGETAATMHQAMKLRGLGQKSRPGWSGRWQVLNHLALLVGNLLLRSYEQSERVYQAMRLRGYGQAPTAGKTTMGLTATRDGMGLTLAVLAIAVGFVVAEVML
jgi:cobalt/nickel transport system permease protein